MNLPSSRSSPRIVLVNSDRDYLALLVRVLADAGYDGRAALIDERPRAVVAETRPAAVVLDVPLGDERASWILLETLLLDPDTQATPVVVCAPAALAVESYQPLLARRGVHVLPKPFTQGELVAAVESAAARRGSPDAEPDGWEPLSAREREVARLVTRGLSNRQIGQAMVIEEGTVANHVRRILLKLSLSSRTQLAVWVTKRTLRRSAAGVD